MEYACIAISPFLAPDSASGFSRTPLFFCARSRINAHSAKVSRSRGISAGWIIQGVYMENAHPFEHIFFHLLFSYCEASWGVHTVKTDFWTFEISVDVRRQLLMLSWLKSLYVTFDCIYPANNRIRNSPVNTDHPGCAIPSRSRTKNGTTDTLFNKGDALWSLLDAWRRKPGNCGWQAFFSLYVFIVTRYCCNGTTYNASQRYLESFTRNH